MALELDLLAGDPEGTWPFPTANSFKTWLGTLDPDTVISEDWGWTGCPIWKFLRHCGWEDPRVFRRGYWHPTPVDEIVETHRTPAWAAEFIWIIDLMKPRRLTAAQSLRVFDHDLYDTQTWLDGYARPLIRSSTGLFS